MSETVTRPRFEMGRVLERTFGAIQRNLISFLLMSVLLKGVVAALMGFAQVQAMANQASGAWGYYALAMGVYLVMSLILQAALAHGVFADLNGGKASIGECLGVSARLLLPLLGIGILVTAATLVGAIFLVIPGIILSLMFSVSAPAEVIERKGVFGSMARSSDLTRDHRWSIFGTLFVLGIIGFVIQMIVLGVNTALMGVIPNAPLITAVVAQPIAYSISGMLSAAGLASIYYELRRVKEGVGPEALANIFD